MPRQHTDIPTGRPISSTGRELHLGVDARSLCGRLTGIGRYVLETLLCLHEQRPDFRITLYCAPGPVTVRIPSEWRVRVIRLPRQVAVKLVFGTLARRDGVDVFWAPQTLIPLGRRLPVVSTVHDLNHKLARESMSWITRWAHTLWFDGDVARASRIVANSRGTAERLRSMLGLRAHAIARPGVHPMFQPQSAHSIAKVRQKYGLTSQYFLNVATLEPRKNIPALLQAYRLLRTAKGEAVPDLVVVGQKGWNVDVDWHEFEGVHALGYVESEDLPVLYSGAVALIIPSIYEGFGMPAAEARACGCPVVATNIPELREAAGPDAIYIKPTVTGICEGLALALGDDRVPARPSRPFDWESCAKVYAEQFKAAARERLCVASKS